MGSIPDHLGNVFKSENAMYRAWNVPEKVGQARKKLNWSLERILTEPVNKVYPDHLGNKFNSEREMYKYWDIPEKLGQARKKLGWDTERILTTPVEKTIPDHIGNLFISEREMYAYWNIPEKLAQQRKRDRWDTERILTTPLQSFQCTDHLGNVFKSEKERANHYGLRANTVSKRLEKGESLEKALTTPSCDYIVKYIDPMTDKVRTRDYLCKKYNIRLSAFRSRIKMYTLIQTLDISIRIPGNAINRINKTKYNLTVHKRITKGKDVFECYIDNGDGTSTFKIMTYEMIDQYCLEQYRKFIK